jgi:hypothetical protein
VEVLTTEFAAERSVAPPGSWYWERRGFRFPKGCNYIKHEIEILEEIPKRAPNDHQPIHDSVRTYAPDAAHGWTGDLFVSIGTFRPHSMSPGPTAIRVRVAVAVECEKQALEKLHEAFGIKY